MRRLPELLVLVLSAVPVVAQEAGIASSVNSRLELKLDYAFDYKSRPPSPEIKKGAARSWLPWFSRSGGRTERVTMVRWS